MQITYYFCRYLQEFTPLGTGGGLYHFRDQIRAGNPNSFFLLNGDVCADFPLKELWTFHEERPSALVIIDVNSLIVINLITLKNLNFIYCLYESLKD